MSTKQGIFFDEWQACLRAHYTHVVRANDTNTEVTLRGVLMQSGLTDNDLDELHTIADQLGPLPDEYAPEGAVKDGVSQASETI